MNILVYGVNGFVGGHLKNRLLALGHSVNGGTRDYPLIPDLLEEPLDAIINAAGEITYPHFMFASNVELVNKILKFARDAKVGKVIQIGSSSEYGTTTAPRREDTPCVATDLYSATKIAATALCQGFAKQHNLDVCVARPFSLYGPGDTPRKLIPRLIESVKGDRMIVFDGNHDWLYIDDFCDGVIALLGTWRDKTQGDIVNFGTGISTTNREVANLIPGTKAEFYEDVQSDYLYSPNWVADAARARERYGWMAKTSLAEGLRKIISLS